MRNRGSTYWEWANPDIHFRNFDERLSCGSLINVQVRLSKESVTQVFVGVYDAKGNMLLENYYPDCRGQTLTIAMAWALQQAHDWIDNKGSLRPPPVSPISPSGQRKRL